MNLTITPILAQFKRRIVAACLLGLFSALLSFFILAICGYLVSHLFSFSHKELKIIYICLFLLISSMASLTHFSENYLKKLNTEMAISNMPGVLRTIIYLPIKKFTELSANETCKLLTDYESALNMIPTTLMRLSSNIILLSMILIFIIYSNTSLGLVYLVSCIALLLVKIHTNPFIKSKLDSYHTTHEQANLILSQAFSQMSKIKTANLESLIHKKWLSCLSLAKRELADMVDIETTAWLFHATALAILLIATLYYAKSLSCIILASQVVFIYEKITSEITTTTNLIAKLNRLRPLLTDCNVSEPSKLHLPSFSGDLQLNNVSFHKLQNISMHITAGSFVGLIGESGTGKSSIFKLILGLEAPHSGSLLLDGININDINMQSIRKHFGVVLQTSRLFPGTIFSNINANTQVTLEDAWQLARLVGLDTDINAMPMKMFTYISDNADNSISGGQRQKILIARALATKPRVLLLDEATSALDNLSQAHIFNNLKSLNITRLVIAHRHSTIAQADRIYRLEKGRAIIVDMGL